MRFLHMADLHLGFTHRGVEILPNIQGGVEGLMRRINEVTLSNMDRALDYAVDKGIDVILIAGDVFDDVRTSLIYQRRLAEFLERAVDNKINIYIVAGNHDVATREISRSSLAIFTRRISHYIRYFDIYPDPEKFYSEEFVGIDHGDASIIPLPYVVPYKDNETDWRKDTYQYLERQLKSAKGRYKVLLGHVQVDRVRFTRLFGKEEVEAMDPGVKILPEISTSELRLGEFDYAALGHIHVSQRIGEYPAYYSGSLNKLRFSEAGDEKVFLDVELTDGSPRVEKVPVDTVNMHFFRIELDKYSSPGEVVEQVVKGVDRLEGAMVSPHISYWKPDLLGWTDEIRKELRYLLAQGGGWALKIRTRFIGSKVVERREATIETIEGALKRYIEDRLKDRDEKFRKKVVETALKYLEEARE